MYDKRDGDHILEYIMINFIYRYFILLFICICDVAFVILISDRGVIKI